MRAFTSLRKIQIRHIVNSSEAVFFYKDASMSCLKVPQGYSLDWIHFF